MRTRLAALIVAAVVVVAACESDQDPGIETDPDAPSTTSVTLGSCPPGGPDDTTPAAGCLDPDGRVVRP